MYLVEIAAILDGLFEQVDIIFVQEDDRDRIHVE